MNKQRLAELREKANNTYKYGYDYEKGKRRASKTKLDELAKKHTTPMYNGELSALLDYIEQLEKTSITSEEEILVKHLRSKAEFRGYHIFNLLLDSQILKLYKQWSREMHNVDFYPPCGAAHIPFIHWTTTSPVDKILERSALANIDTICGRQQ